MNNETSPPSATHTQLEFERLFTECSNRNMLYFLYTLFAWSATDRTYDFISEVNKYTEDTIYSITRGAAAARPIDVHDALFAIQLNLEAKAFYAVLRNFVSILTGRHVRPEPWEREEIRKKPPSLSTTVIIRNIVNDLKDASFPDIANEFNDSHTGLASIIRNAVAHATFLTPNWESRQDWIFSTYKLTASGCLELCDHVVTNAEFTALLRRLLQFRLDFMRAIQAKKTEYRPQTFNFQAKKQMKPDEVLDCSFDRGCIRFTHRGTHIW